MTTSGPRLADELAGERTDFAAKRTLMAADRTLMAWIRTALSMISFGFTIYKVLQGFQASGAALPRPDSPRNVGLVLTGLGTLSMLLGTTEYLLTVKDLRPLVHCRILRPSLVMALLMSAVGSFIFVAIVGRVL